MPERASADAFTALHGVFLARFFENEFTTGFDDLKSAFFWMLAALAVPGVFIPWMLNFDWHLVGVYRGPEALREVSRGSKLFYLGFSMAAAGGLTLVAWNSLLPDRRDALVLGALPVRSSAVVGARLTALATYILLVAVGMHALGSLFFGLMLATGSGGSFVLRGIAAHFLASTAASASLALTVAAVQGLLLATAGARIFARLSPILYGTLVAILALGLASLPLVAFSVTDTVRGGPLARAWSLWLPHVWFLGLYEWMLGTSDPVLLRLAGRAAWMLAAGALATAAVYPLVYRRQMVASLEEVTAPARGIGGLVRALLVAAAGRDPGARATAEFYTGTIARVERHRFVITLAVGVAIAWCFFAFTALDAPGKPEPAWLSLPVSAMLLVVAGLRVAASLPGDLRAGWVFESRGPSRAQVRRALRRIVMVAGVLPPVLLAAPVFWWLWGAQLALTHAAVTVVTGALIVEVLLKRVERMPCGEPWMLARADLGRRWPLWVGAFAIVSTVLPRISLLGTRIPAVALVFVVLIALATAAVRWFSARQVLVPLDDADPVAGVLGLS